MVALKKLGVQKYASQTILSIMALVSMQPLSMHKPIDGWSAV